MIRKRQLSRLATSGPTGVQRLSLLGLVFIGLLTQFQPVLARDYIYTVRPGDNLWNLTKRYLKDDMRYWASFQRLNNIERPRYIPPGSKLRIPMRWLKVQPASAHAVQVVGNVEILAASSQSARPLSPRDSLQVGDRVKTAAESSAVLEFADGSRLLLQADSTLELDTMSAYGDTWMVDTRLRLPAGRVETNAKPSTGPGSRYEITTPAAVAAVRGTNFRVSASADSTVTRSEVLEGRVGVSADEVTELVKAGFGTIAESGKPPLPPRELLPAPNLEALPSVVRRLPFGFDWPALADAAGYRAQIYPRGQLDTLLYDRKSERPAVRGLDLQDGDYLLRIRGIDELGLEGLNADHPFTLDARPIPPVLLNLVDDVVVRDQRPLFRWSLPEGSAAYNMQVARDANFAQLVVDLRGHQEAELKPTTALPYGRLFWRVTSIGASGEEGPPSDAESFQIKPIPAKPSLDEATVDENEIQLRWRTVDYATSYDIQIARDEDFTRLLTEQHIPEPKFALPRPASGTYYMRVRALDDEGYPGPYGDTHRIEVPFEETYWPLLLLLAPFVL